MTTTQAAIVIGCTGNHVRTLIRMGKLKARKIVTPVGHYYEVDDKSVRQYASIPQRVGYPRGRKRVERVLQDRNDYVLSNADE